MLNNTNLQEYSILMAHFPKNHWFCVNFFYYTIFCFFFCRNNALNSVFQTKILPISCYFVENDDTCNRIITNENYNI